MHLCVWFTENIQQSNGKRNCKNETVLINSRGPWLDNLYQGFEVSAVKRLINMYFSKAGK